MTGTIKIGDRVQLNPAKAEGYNQPWPERIRRGLFGTVRHDDGGRLFVQWDMPTRAKWPYDWRWQVDPLDLLRVAE